MNKWIFRLLLFCFFFGHAAGVSANNLEITNVSLEDRDSDLNTVIVEFDISWENSWRNSTNYDAVWVVVKLNVGAYWYHGYLDQGGYDPPGTSSGTNDDVEIYVPTDTISLFANAPEPYYIGAFIYRRSSGTGSFVSEDVRLKVNYGTASDVAVEHSFSAIADTTTIKAKVVGVEMVYVPEGVFQAGDTTSTGRFSEGSSDSDPWYIDSDGTIKVGNATTGTYYYTTGSSPGEFASGTQFTIPGYFPVGYDAFFCMKYELTEGQWVEFFNTLVSTQQDNLDVTAASGKNSDSVIARNTISWSGSGNATTTRPSRTMNYINVTDLAAYLDWMGLRPMSELEFEKAARGPLSPVAGEYAWGDTTITAGVAFSISPELGNETFSTANANAHYNITTFSSGDDYLGAQHVQGGTRAGIFATSTSTRSSSGAGYYGAMELSGNLTDRPVTVGNTSGILYVPIHGDGWISVDTCFGAGDLDGKGNQLGWPGMLTEEGVSSALGWGGKGGWAFANTTQRTSDRAIAAFTLNTRVNYGGGRGVRSEFPMAAFWECGDVTLEGPEQCNLDDETYCTALGTSCDTTICMCTSGSCP